MKGYIKGEIEYFLLEKINTHRKYVGHMEQAKEYQEAYDEFCENILEE